MTPPCTGRLKRKIVTADALFCSRAFAKTVIDRGGNYALALKKNQGKLFADVERRFARKGARHTAQTLKEATHDRHERRTATIMRNSTLAGLHKFPGIAAIARDYIAAPAQRLRSGQTLCPLVHPFPICLGQEATRDRPLSLGCRKPVALGSRCRLRGGRKSRTQGRRTRKPRRPAKDRHQPPASPTKPHLHATQNERRRLGRRLLSQPLRPKAIAPACTGALAVASIPSYNTVRRWGVSTLREALGRLICHRKRRSRPASGSCAATGTEYGRFGMALRPTVAHGRKRSRKKLPPSEAGSGRAPIARSPLASSAHCMS